MSKNGASFVYPEKSLVEKARRYQSNAYTHPLISAIFWNRFKTGFNLVKSKRYGQVLEVGCEYGFALPMLCALGDKVIGTDVGETFAHCKNTTLSSIQTSCPNLELREANVTQLSKTVQPDSCDLVASFSVLEHVKDYKTAMNEIKTCMKSGGIFLCELPSENWLYKLGKNVARYPDVHQGYSYGPYREYLRSIFTEVKLVNSPYGIPLFKIAVYEKK